MENRDRLEVEEMMEQPDVPRALSLCARRQLLDIDVKDVTYYLTRERILRMAAAPCMLEKIVSFLSPQRREADRYFKIPPELVVEVAPRPI